eukprot:gene1006-2612_t
MQLEVHAGDHSMVRVAESPTAQLATPWRYSPGLS